MWLQGCGGAGLGHRYHSRFFCKVVIALAAEMVDEIQGRVHQQLLPALGVAADLELTSDGVSIQKTKAMPWGLSSIVLIGSVRSHHLTGKNTSACVDVSNHGTDWRGFATTKLFMDKLASPPFRLGLDQLSARVAAFPGDGALCKGGPASRHPSSDMGGHLFRSLARPDRSVWDLMHRLHTGGLRAIHQSSLLGEIVSVTKDLKIKLGFGQGLPVMLAVDECNDYEGRVFSLKSPVPGRILTGYGEVLASYLVNFNRSMAALLLRRFHATAAGESRNSTPIGDWDRLIQQMVSPRLVLGALFVSGVFTSIIKPMMLVSQSLDIPPWQEHARTEVCIRQLGGTRCVLKGVYRLTKLFIMLVPYLVRRDVATARGALRCLLWGSSCLQLARLGCSEAGVAIWGPGPLCSRSPLDPHGAGPCARFCASCQGPVAAEAAWPSAWLLGCHPGRPARLIEHSLQLFAKCGSLVAGRVFPMVKDILPEVVFASCLQAKELNFGQRSTAPLPLQNVGAHPWCQCKARTRELRLACKLHELWQAKLNVLDVVATEVASDSL